MENDFKKTDSQKKAINTIVNNLATNVLLYGGSRSAKSFTIMFAIIVRASKVKSDHIIVRETFNAAKVSIWKKTLPTVFNLAFPYLSYKLDKSDYVCTLPNGSEIKIGGLDDDKRLERLLGTEYSTIWINEANQVPYSGVNKLKSRLAQKNDLRKLVFYDLNPTTTTSWVYQLFMQKVDPQDGEMLDDPKDYLSIKMDVQGNLENIDVNYIKMLEKLPKKERLRFLEGEFDNENTGAAVYSFNKEDHVTEEAVKLEGTDWVGSDFNIDFNSDIIASQHANGIFVHNENQIAGDTYQKAFALIEKGFAGATIVCDSTGKNRSTKGRSDVIILREAGFDVRIKTNPSVKDKIANLNRCFTLGLIKINPKCKKLIRDLTQLKWDKRGQLDQKTDPSLSHLVDGLAYLVWYLYPLVDNINRFSIGKTN